MKDRHPGCVLALAAAAAVLLAGCGVPSASEGGDDSSFPRPQAMVVVASERSRYEKAYTDAIWDTVLADGTTFETYLLEQIQGFLKDVKTMNLLAEEQEISVTSAERDRLRQLAETYYAGMSEGDLAWTGADQEDVEAIYEAYFLANKAAGELTRHVDLEVSDSEAKVIVIKQLRFDSEEEAAAVWETLQQENADFETAGRDGGAEPEQRPLARGEETASFEEAAFALASGEISAPVESGGSWYLIQCVSDYDPEATSQRKTRIYAERKNQVFQQIYNQFQSEHPLQFSDQMWTEIVFSDTDAVQADQFFSLYQEEFGSQGY